MGVPSLTTRGRCFSSYTLSQLSISCNKLKYIINTKTTCLWLYQASRLISKPSVSDQVSKPLWHGMAWNFLAWSFLESPTHKSLCVHLYFPSTSKQSVCLSFFLLSTLSCLSDSLGLWSCPAWSLTPIISPHDASESHSWVPLQDQCNNRYYLFICLFPQTVRASHRPRPCQIYLECVIMY